MEHVTMLLNGMLAFLSLLLILSADAEEFHGRRVCHHQKTVAVPISAQQSYIRAVFRKDIQRTIYQTAYKTVFRMQIRTENMTGCCPGWEKRTPREPDCMKPMCDEPCENEGQCMGPGICVCSEGYTGYKCHLDIDECTGRNSCQQKCKNLPGSYECSCQEGFVLADDEYSCDLCLSCTDEFKKLYSQIESFPNISKLDNVIENIMVQVNNITTLVVSPDTIQGIQAELDNLKEVTIHSDEFHELQTEVDTLKGVFTEVDAIKDLNKRVDILQESSLQAERLHEIQAQIKELAEVKTLKESIQTLNVSIQTLQEDDTQARKLLEIQKQVEDLAVIKAQQDEAQLDKFEEMTKELEQLRKMKGLSESLEEMKGLLLEMSGRIQGLEADKEQNIMTITLQAERYDALQKEIDSLKTSVKQVDLIKDLSTRVDTLQESSLHTSTFENIQSQLNDLAPVKDVMVIVQSLNDTVRKLENDDTQKRKLREMETQIEDLIVVKAQQEKAQTDRYAEMQSELQRLQEIHDLSSTVTSLQVSMEYLSKRVQELEADKTALKNNLTDAVSHYEAAISALQAKEVTQEHVTTDLYDVNPDRLVSLSAQISILEERMATCQCGQDYPHG